MTHNNPHLINHPLIRHKISKLRDQETGVRDFRRLVHEITLLLGYESARDLTLKSQIIQTPLQKTEAQLLAKPVCLVPVLRAGLGMTEAMLELFPDALVGHLGLYRDHETLKPVEYYHNLPANIADCDVFILDPMLATGGSASAAVDFLKEKGAVSIRMLNLIASPEGVQNFLHSHSEIPIYLGTLDQTINENGYILPGLGDAGDRLFGTL